MLEPRGPELGSPHPVLLPESALPLQNHFGTLRGEVRGAGSQQASSPAEFLEADYFTFK